MVLDLSGTRITELLYSISQLESLEVPLLKSCSALRFIPYVGKLGCLRKLDLKACESLEEVPEGMEKLVNLRYLALDGTEIETLPEGVLGKLVNLQYLVIKKLRAGEEVKLPKVEALHCFVPMWKRSMLAWGLSSEIVHDSTGSQWVHRTIAAFGVGVRLRGVYPSIVATISLRV
ncbi:hypothetical protein NL676_024211 [Syzygium grande]|nr:hypothetical protein NL676_024211 [Syzygium grande]